MAPGPASILRLQRAVGNAAVAAQLSEDHEAERPISKVVSGGGTDRYAIISSGGMGFIHSTGTVSAATVTSGGKLVVGAGGAITIGIVKGRCCTQQPQHDAGSIAALLRLIIGRSDIGYSTLQCHLGRYPHLPAKAKAVLGITGLGDNTRLVQVTIRHTVTGIGCTTAFTSSPKSELGTPNTAASAILGWVISRFSHSCG